MLPTTAVLPLSTLLIAALVRSTASQSERIVVPVTFKDNRLYGKISVGKPKDGKEPQVFIVDFNVQTAVFWIASIAACPKSGCSNTKHKFNGFDGPNSATYKPTEKTFYYKLSSGARIRCNVVRDQFRLGSEGNTLLIEDQPFGETSNMFNTKFSPTNDGVFGLNLVSHEQSADAPVWAIAKQPSIEPVFSFYIKSHQSQPADLIIGGKDEDLIDGELDSHDVVKSGDEYDGWLIKIDKLVIKWNDEPEDFTLSTSLAVPSPSNLFIDLPALDKYNFNKKLFFKAKFTHDNYAFTFSCNNNWESLPDVIIVMDGKEYEMTPKDYIVDRMERNQCGSGFTHAAGLDIKTEAKAVVLGQIFLKKFYTRFNIGAKQVQIAKAKRVQAEGDPHLPMGASSANH